jgi:hypothetical protein
MQRKRIYGSQYSWNKEGLSMLPANVMQKLPYSWKPDSQEKAFESNCKNVEKVFALSIEGISPVCQKGFLCAVYGHMHCPTLVVSPVRCGSSSFTRALFFSEQSKSSSS